MYVCMYVHNGFTVEVYEFNVSYHTHMHALYGKEDDKLHIAGLGS